jgi:Domain of unknown function (DUF4384)
MRIITLVAAAVALTLAGCATPYRPTGEDANFAAQASAANRPLIQPARSFSSYSSSLACMDHLLRDMRLPTTLITSKYIPDASGKVTVAAKEMVITALSQMSRTSSAFRFVDYEVDIVRQDTVQNLTTLLLGANQMQIQRPALYVSGAISFVDQNIINNRSDVGTSASRLELAYSKNRASTLVGLELHLGEFRTRTLIPGIESANEVVISNGGQGLDVAGRIGSYGVQFNVGRDFTQGTGAALRTLVELGVIEVIGKWARVPYWQCLSLDQTHPDFQRSLLDWYNADSEAQKRTNVINALSARGYLKATGVANDAELKRSLVRFQADEDLVTHGQITFEVYERALRDYVRVDTQGHFSRVGWDRTQVVSRKVDDLFNPKTLADTDAVGAASSALSTSNHIDLKIENVPSPANRMGTSFEVGEQLFMSAVLPQTAHVWCYYQDATNSVIRLYPNAVHRNSLTQANRSIRLPDWMNPNPGFFIEAADPGLERVMCLSHEKDLLADVTTGALATPPLNPMNGETLESINARFEGLSNDGMLGSGSVGWAVRAKTPVVAAAPAPAPAAAKPKSN